MFFGNPKSDAYILTRPLKRGILFTKLLQSSWKVGEEF